MKCHQNLRLYGMNFFITERSKFQKYSLLAHEFPKPVVLRASSVSPTPPPHLLCSVLSSSQRLLGSLPPGATKLASSPSPSWEQLPAQLLLSLHPSQNLPSPHHRPVIQDTQIFSKFQVSPVGVFRWNFIKGTWITKREEENKNKVL